MALSEKLRERLEKIKDSLELSEGEEIDELVGEVPETEPINVKELKTDLKELNAQIDEMSKMRDSLVKMAQDRGGWGEGQKEAYQNITKSIEDSTMKSIEKAALLTEYRESKLDNIKHSVKEVASKINEGFREMIGGAVDKALAGVATLEGIEDKTKDFLEKQAAGRETIATNLISDVEKSHRKFMSFEYAVNERSQNTLEKIAEAVEKAAQKTANIKQAFANLGRAITGKEQDRSEAQASEFSKSMAAKFRGHIEELKQDNKDLSMAFYHSKEKSLERMNATKDVRENAGISESEKFEQRLKSAKEESIDMKKDREKAPEKDTKQKDEQEIS